MKTLLVVSHLWAIYIAQFRLGLFISYIYTNIDLLGNFIWSFAKHVRWEICGTEQKIWIFQQCQLSILKVCQTQTATFVLPFSNKLSSKTKLRLPIFKNCYGKRTTRNANKCKMSPLPVWKWRHTYIANGRENMLLRKYIKGQNLESKGKKSVTTVKRN